MENEIKLKKKHVFYTEHILEVGDIVTVKHANVPARVIFIDYENNLIYLLKSGSVPEKLEGRRPYRHADWPNFNFVEVSPNNLIFICGKDIDYVYYLHFKNETPIVSQKVIEEIKNKSK